MDVGTVCGSPGVFFSDETSGCPWDEVRIDYGVDLSKGFKV